MRAVLIFAVTLLLAALVSGVAQRSVLSTAVLFLLTGFVTGRGVFDVIPLSARDPAVARLTELALFSVLYTDSMRTNLHDLRANWRLPGRALGIGLPLTLVATALVAHGVAGLSWAASFLLGAVLSPTDPVLAAAIVGRREVPRRLRRLLNVESGLNDGLALPVVVVMLAIVGARSLDIGSVLGKVVLGVAAGIAIAWGALWLEHRRFLAAIAIYQPIYVFAIGVLVLAVTSLAGVNEFLAAFAAGATVATVDRETQEAFRQIGEFITEVLKLAALMVFGALISPGLLADIPSTGYVFAALALVAVRPAALAAALAGTDLSRREWIAAAWFGPKGFSSVFYALLILRAGIPDAEQLYHLAAVVIAASIIAHSSTDVVVAGWFRQERKPKLSRSS